MNERTRKRKEKLQRNAGRTRKRKDKVTKERGNERTNERTNDTILKPYFLT